MNSTSTKSQHQHEFISPPVTPKLQLESTFSARLNSEEDGWDTSSTNSSTSSLHMPIMYTRNNRRKQKPMQSLPKSTQGSFFMPTFVTEEVPQLISSSLSTKRKHVEDDETTVTTVTTLPTTKKTIVSLATAPAVATPTINEVLHHSKEDEMMVKLDKEHIVIAADQPIKLNEEVPLQQEEEVQIIKKSKTTAAYVYDHLTAESDQAILFMNSEEWIPKLSVFDRRPTVRISWKGSPLKIRNMPYFEKLHAGEASIAATLRLTPEQYLKCKWALVLAAKEASENNTLFRKSEAQKVCCIDVNKTSVLWNAFGKLGWLGSKWPQ